MAKKFNITGLCIPAEHFTADMSMKVGKIMEMVVNGDYFTINRPRQYGKTTIMYLLEQRLKMVKEYLIIDISFEGIDSPTYENHEQFISTFLEIMKEQLEFLHEQELWTSLENDSPLTNFKHLNSFITRFVEKSARKVLLMIDEVDKACNNKLFLDFLGMLRTKYLNKKKGKDHTFHSVILAGVHDVKTLKAKLRPGEKKMYNSPWNIAVDFNVDMSLSPAEIASLLEQYVKEKQVSMDIAFLADKLFYFTSGYPFLVSYLCKIVDEKILPGKSKKEWLPEDLVKAVQIAIAEDNTNFDSLIKNLENNPDLYELVFHIIMNEGDFTYNRHNAVIRFGAVYGILKEEKGKVKIHNRLYEQIIYDYMSSNLETSGGIGMHNIGSSYVEKDGGLNMEKIVRKFQQFMKEQYSKKDTAFIERNGKLLFLAFIKPIINGKGFDFKEVQVSEEKRLDIVITFEKQKYIIELKIWRGESYHQAGLRQLCDYLEGQEQSTGYLLIFDLRKESSHAGEIQQLEIDRKKILAAWV